MTPLGCPDYSTLSWEWGATANTGPNVHPGTDLTNDLWHGVWRDYNGGPVSRPDAKSCTVADPHEKWNRQQ